MDRSVFNTDLHNEKILADYLDQYFYPIIGIPFTRVENMEDQFKGIDVRFNHRNREYLVDEKGYLSRPTIQNTFVLELSFVNKQNKRVEGWFYNPDKYSTHYLLCWADRDNIDIYKQPLIIDNLRRVEVMLVNRLVLHNYLIVQYGINRQFINEHLDDLLRELLKNGSINLHNSNSKYVFSTRLPEQPLNIVMTKDEVCYFGCN